MIHILLYSAILIITGALIITLALALCKMAARCSPKEQAIMDNEQAAALAKTGDKWLAQFDGITEPRRYDSIEIIKADDKRGEK